jgi:hypothetical protein
MVLSEATPFSKAVYRALVYFNKKIIPYVLKFCKKKLAYNPHLVSRPLIAYHFVDAILYLRFINEKRGKIL